jgi:hypothetical protein
MADEVARTYMGSVQETQKPFGAGRQPAIQTGIDVGKTRARQLWGKNLEMSGKAGDDLPPIE